MGDDATMSKKKVAAGQYTHWARPRWIRMYTYNYEFGESYYRPQVRYVSTSRVASELNSSSSYSSTLDSRREFQSRRRAVSPPRAMSFIERWSAEPFYGRGYYGRATSMARAERESSQYRSTREESAQREMSQYRSSRAESVERESSQYQHVSRTSSEMRSRRAQSEVSRSVNVNVSDRSNYASSSLLQQINNVRATSAALQEESAVVQERLRQRRARSVEALRRAEEEYLSTLHGASDDCLMRSDVLLDSARRSRREQSVLADVEARYSRERSVSRMRDEEDTAENVYLNYDYPRHHLVCSEKCPHFTDPVHHRRFVIGPRFVDAAALGGFDVLYDPTVYKKTRKLLQRLSEERDVDTSVYEATRESSMERGRSRLAYKTIY